LIQAHELLKDCTEEFVNQRQQFKEAERAWIGERSKLVQQLEAERKKILSKFGLRSQIVQSCDPHAVELAKNENLDPKAMVFHGATRSSNKLMSVVKELRSEREKHYEQAVENLKSQLLQQQSMVEMYRYQISELEDSLAEHQEEASLSREQANKQSSKLQERIDLANKRLRESEKRRQLDREGYQNDVQALRRKAREIEQQMIKLMKNLVNGTEMDDTLFGGNLPENVELAILQSIRDMSSKGCKLSNQLQTLKAKIYSIEKDLRRI
ncbi:Coiled-coil domain-containing protein 77, partial [Cichlidogyrus casuarinus]